MDPIAILKSAIEKVPSVKYALGAAAVAAAGSIITELLGHDRAATITIGATFAAMVLLYAFAVLVQNDSRVVQVPGIALLYTVTFTFCFFVAITASAFTIGKPTIWACFLFPSECPIPPAPIPPKVVCLPRVWDNQFLNPDQARDYTFDMSAPGTAKATVTNIHPDFTNKPQLLASYPGTPEIYMRLCNSSNQSACGGQQFAEGVPYEQPLTAGPGRIQVYHFKAFPVPISYTLSVICP